MIYQFDWDPAKAAANVRKHGVRFEQAATVFQDPRALSIFDSEHSDDEDRWITLGFSADGGLLVVHHTFTAIEDSRASTRIISSRKATTNETKQYME